MVAHLRRSPFDLHAAASWEHLLAASERLEAGVVLVDLDAAERSHSLRRLGLSGHRLVTLLARQLAEKAVALVVLTTLDYAEIEDLMRAGVHALLHPEREGAWCVEQVRAALARRQNVQAQQTQISRPESSPDSSMVTSPVRALVPIPPAALEAALLSSAAEPIAAFL
jgi:DNA-binding NarL/FixJ family response regulator